MDPIVARKMHGTLEAFHGMIYFSPEATAEYEALGASDPRTGYFASRAAPMGAVAAPVVAATFFNFNPTAVEAAMAGAWATAEPGAWTEARMSGVDATLRRLAGDLLDGDDVGRALDLARTAVDGCRSAGRPLAAGLLGVEPPPLPHLALWHAVAVLREYRGDGHVAVLVDAGLTPCESLLTHAATGVVPVEALKATRAWPEEAWDEAADALRARGLLDGDRAFTEAGARFREDIEQRTDRAALAPWRALGEDGCTELRALVRPISRALVDGGAFSV